VHRPVAALPRHVPALPARRRRGGRRESLSSPPVGFWLNFFPSMINTEISVLATINGF
jgi:hypothetical protein